jgi:hypothetical protein
LFLSIKEPLRQMAFYRVSLIGVGRLFSSEGLEVSSRSSRGCGEMPQLGEAGTSISAASF